MTITMTMIKVMTVMQITIKMIRMMTLMITIIVAPSALPKPMTVMITIMTVMVTIIVASSALLMLQNRDDKADSSQRYVSSQHPLCITAASSVHYQWCLASSA